MPGALAPASEWKQSGASGPSAGGAWERCARF